MSLKNSHIKILRDTVLSVSLAVLAGCVSIPPTGQQVYLKDICSEYLLSYSVDEVTGVVTLRKGASKAQALIGSEVVIVGTKNISLAAPLYRVPGGVIVPYDFRDQVIDTMLGVAVQMKARPMRVVIDAGHGGHDPGAISRGGVEEKGIVLDIARRLGKELSRKGIDVTLTRSRDEFIPLEKRTEIASAAEADLFISIHANSEPSRRVTGIEVYSCRELGYSEKREAQRLRNHRILYKKLAAEQNDPVLPDILEDMIYRHKRAESPKLSQEIAKRLSRDLKTKDRGSRTSGFFVVRNNLMPSVLVEVGFLSHYREESLLQKSAYRQQIADSLTESILLYANR